MSVWYMLMDPRFGVYRAPNAPRAFRGSLGSAARGRSVWQRVLSAGGSVSQALSAAIARRRAIAELDALDDRLLRDIGISRHDIPKVAERAAVGMTVMPKPVAEPRFERQPARGSKPEYSLAA